MTPPLPHGSTEAYPSRQPDDATPTLDLEEQLRSERAARLHAEAEVRRLEGILASITDAFFVLDAEWRFTYVNTEAERYLFREHTDLLQKRIWDEFPDTVGSIFDEHYHRSMQEQVMVDFEVFYPPLSAWFQVRARPLAGGLSVHFRDVTSDKRAQEALKYSEERYRFLAESIPAQVWTAKPDGALDYVTQRVADYFGRSQAQVLGEGWQDGVHPEDLATVAQRWTRSLATGDDYEVEFRLRRVQDGSYRWHIGRAVAHRDPGGAVVFWVGVNTDVEELRRLAAALERSNQELDQFAYIASHDLKAPLQGIARLSEWIEEDLADRLTDQSREHLLLLRGRMVRMEELINGILRYSRAGRKQADPELVDVTALLSVVLELLCLPPDATVDVSADMPVLLTELVPLQQVFLNLIGNAVKHNERPEARVTVVVEDAGACYRFLVTDNGPGIAPAFHERIWGIFQTLRARDRFESTGIGLSVVKKIVQSRGGVVGVESQEGKGATFFFTWRKSPMSL